MFHNHNYVQEWLTESRDVDKSLRSLTGGKSDEGVLLEVLSLVVDDQTKVFSRFPFSKSAT